MIPPRDFPKGTLELVEVSGGQVIKSHARFTSSNGDRIRIQNLRNDLLMTNPTLDLQIRENGV